MESAVATAFLRSVMGRFFKVLEKEYTKHKGLAQETESIQEELSMIAAAMDDQIRALGKHNRTAVSRLHSEVMLDLTHDIEDSIDRFMHRLRYNKHRASFVHRLTHKVKKVKIRSAFADEVQELKARLREAHQRVIRAIPTACGGMANGWPSTTACSMEPYVTHNPVGFEKPLKEIKSLLEEVNGEQDQLRVISIVGFGGSGKTTLARAVYESPEARAKFECRAWVPATRGSPEASDGVTAILRVILQLVLPKDTMEVDSQHQETSLKEYLRGKRYLIVIDDIREDEWSAIYSAFEDNKRSSRIILTTTTRRVANMCTHGSGYVYQMDTLSEEDSKKIVFPGVTSPELDQGSAALLGKCDGLPLALVSVSHYLKSSTEPTGELCQKLCRNLGSYLKKHHANDNFSELRRMLFDNYDNFSGYALNSLLYLGIFPNNRPVKRKVLLRRWIAEGYARSDDFSRFEQDIADENFDELIDRNIIHPVDTRNNSQVKTCKTHGIMHEFVVHKSLSQRFLSTWSTAHPRLGGNANCARHLSIHAGEPTECVASDEDLSRVRSLTAFGDTDGAISYVRKCKMLRVLDLEECHELEDHHLKHICKLWNLKYLSLGGTICELPRCIERLHCIETLDLRRTKINLLPIEAIELPHLAHLFGKFMLDKNDLKNVNKMSKLQKFLSGDKGNLQTLAGFITDDNQGFLQLIGQMKKLRKVKIWCKRATNNYVSALSLAIQELSKVPLERAIDRSLSLDFEGCPENFLSSLDLEPCSEGFKYDLRNLKLQGKFLELPPFVNLLSGLTELCISSDTLTRGIISALVRLRNLLYLKLVAYQLENFEIKQGTFPSLRRLCFVVQSLTSPLPTIEQGALPNLVSLQLLYQGLVGLSGINIKHFKYLKEITIHKKVNAQTRRDWDHAAMNHPNRPRLLLLETAYPIESRELESCVMLEKRKRCVAQPNSEDGLDSKFKKMKVSEPSGGGNELNVIVQYSSASAHLGT